MFCFVELLLLISSDLGSVEMVYVSRETLWHMSPEETGRRQLMIVSLLRPFLEDEGKSRHDLSVRSSCHAEYERYAAEAIAFYTASLPDDIVHAGVDYFAFFYLHTSRESNKLSVLSR